MKNVRKIIVISVLSLLAQSCGFTGNIHGKLPNNLGGGSIGIVVEPQK